jgi:hypothetical protein
MKTQAFKIFASVALFSAGASAFAQQGYMMPGGTLGNYQPAMQPGAYVAQGSQGPGEQVAYQQPSTMPCSPRGTASAIEGPIANGNLIPTNNGRQRHYN